ncbi:MAG: polyprenyl synthetase family protein [Deltaproteobacteria bacterium]|nr:polyprenyl synthetase family protein [Deltaproteobacteria bacterium]
MNPEDPVLGKHAPLLRRINEELERALSSRVGLVEEMGGHTLLGGGKRFRPLVFILCCRMCGYQEEDSYRLSTIFEYIHAASLLHDDVLDNAEVRRKRPSANNIWGNHAAVLEGDFLFTKALSLAVSSGNLAFLKTLTDTTARMTEGQILELMRTNDWSTTREQYMEIITAKTATLISAACVCAGLLAQVDEGALAVLERFGLDMGIAFQYMDDLLDYTSRQEIFGKPVGKDLREGKVTLPLINALETLDPRERERLAGLFGSGRASEEDYRTLTELVRERGALDQILREAASFVNRAAASLQRFPDSYHRRDLVELSRYIVERRY